MEKLQKKFNALIGCPTYIDKKNGYLIIDSKAKVLKLNHNSYSIGMFWGLNKLEKGYELVVTYDGGNAAIYQPKFCKII